ncbi:MAG: inositol monophosphatase [Candidatus Bathyarchaeota archaeon]|nr:inositol monophosphatase [Candidatus Bathyarchaeota archaeon]
MEKNSLDALKEIAKEIFSVARPLLGTAESGRVVGSGFGGDKTVLIDEAAEQAIIRYLERNGLACTFIGEERGVQKIGANPGFYLIADAVDGTTNAVRGINFVSASLAISPTDCLDDLEAGVVMNLFDGGIYEAEKGKGARYNGGKIRPSGTAALEDSVLSVDVSRTPRSVERTASLMKAVKGVRALGSAAMEICHVASGLLDAYVDLRGKLRTLDMAAGMLILREAGGIFLQPDGEGFHGFSLTDLNRFSVVAAANKEIYDKIVSLVSK